MMLTYLRIVSYLIVLLVSIILRQKSCYKYIIDGSAIFSACMIISALGKVISYEHSSSIGSIAITFGAFLWGGLFFVELLKHNSCGEK